MCMRLSTFGVVAAAAVSMYAAAAAAQCVRDGYLCVRVFLVCWEKNTMPCEHDGLIEDELYYDGRRGVHIHRNLPTIAARVQFVSFGNFSCHCVCAASSVLLCLWPDDLLRPRFIYIAKSK